MNTAYIGIGSNLVNPLNQVQDALTALHALKQTRFIRSSRLYHSKPWGKLNQPDFINAVALVETALSPQALLEELLAIERHAGRIRGHGHWEPRVLDLDLLLYADRVVEEPNLTIPHAHMHERPFVLLPLAEIAPALNIPGRGEVSRLLAQVDASACRVLAAQAS